METIGALQHLIITCQEALMSSYIFLNVSAASIFSVNSIVRLFIAYIGCVSCTDAVIAIQSGSCDTGALGEVKN